jgi:hypothetical protein
MPKPLVSVIESGFNREQFLLKNKAFLGFADK